MRYGVLLLCIVVAGVHCAAQTGAVTREEYLAYAERAAEDGWNGLEASHEQWRKTIDVNYVFGYAPPGNDPYLAALYANLYLLTKNPTALERVRTLLVGYGEFKKAYPPDYAAKRPEYAAGLPALPNIFTFPKYVHAYNVLKSAGAVSAADRRVIEQNIAESADLYIDFQEWGPMNRAILRAEGVGYAAKVLPDHPHQPRWAMYARAIATDSWGQWEIEDATGYHPVWLYSLMGYASDVQGDESLYRTPVMLYYNQYFLHLVSPAGIVPDFGDADLAGSFERMIPFFEKGAAVTRDPQLRWAAAQYFRRWMLARPGSPVYYGLIVSDACRWADFSVSAQTPGVGSGLVMDDVVGKKAVFRNGWDSTSTYLLYNYRDEGDGGWLAREYLRTSIPVEEEKMTHGHSDEQSVNFLMRNGSILLHDGGYRDFMPSGAFGSYRADYFHNRVAVRDGKIALGQKEGQYRYATPGWAAVPGQGLLEFLRNSGAYRDVRTLGVDFLPVTHFDMVRSRLLNPGLGYESDRVVVYVKDLDWFVVFDGIRYTRNTFLTMANLWHTRTVHARGEGWFDTSYDSLRTRDVRGSERLLIAFPYRERLEEGVEPQKRYYQDEQMIYQMIGRHGYTGNLQPFVTVLAPHDAKEKPEDVARCIRLLEVSPFPRAAGVEITRNGKKYIVGVKLDMEAEMVNDWRRPMYTFEAGAIRYGDYVTDAYHFFAVEDGKKATYTMAGGVKILYRDRVLHEQRAADSGLRFDGGPNLPGIGKVRYWEETFTK
jgi:hypothetical protein